MKRRYRVFRGEVVLGYVGFDDQWPCEPFEPTDAFNEVKDLFDKEHELGRLAGEVDERGDVERFDQLMSEADAVMDEIVAPGIHFEALEKILCSFDCDQLSIFDGRVCWR